LLLLCAPLAIGQGSTLPDGKVGEEYSGHIWMLKMEIVSCSIKGNGPRGLSAGMAQVRGSHGKVYRECLLAGVPTKAGKFSFSVEVGGSNGEKEVISERMVIR
jgi:hypothetical protein